MSDKHDIEAAGLADYSKDVCRIATVLEKRDEIIDRLRADNKALLDALKYVIGTREIKCLHFPESAPDRACAKCRADAAIEHSEPQ